MKCLFIFVHFVGAEGLVIIRRPGTSHVLVVPGAFGSTSPLRIRGV